MPNLPVEPERSNGHVPHNEQNGHGLVADFSEEEENVEDEYIPHVVRFDENDLADDEVDIDNKNSDSSDKVLFVISGFDMLKPSCIFFYGFGSITIFMNPYNLSDMIKWHTMFVSMV